MVSFQHLHRFVVYRKDLRWILILYLSDRGGLLWQQPKQKQKGHEMITDG